MCALIAAGLLAVSGPAAQAESPSSATSVVDSSSAPTADAAAAVATAYGHSVAIDDQTTETSQVSAEPDGTMTLVSDAEPVRVQRNGSWIPTDNTLRAGTDWIEPAVAASPVRFSAGGSDVMAQVQTSSGAWVSETWPEGDLPAPTVSGSDAVYANVLPDVDLHLTATASGMSEVLVVKNADAAANPALKDLQLQVSDASLSVNGQQTTVAAASDGSKIMAASPTWWDSSQAGASAVGPGGAGEPLPLPHTTDSDSVNLHVSAVANTSAQYPVYVDPDWSSGQQAYWFTDVAYPTQSYLNGNQSAGYQSVGKANQDGLTYQSHAFWQFGIGALAKKHIIKASFEVGLTYSCSATSLELWDYGPSTAGFTWNNDPNAWNYKLDTQTPAAGSGCAVSNAMSWNALASVVNHAAASSSTVQFGFRSTDENSLSTRKHFNQGASLVVQYNSTPGTPSDVTFSGPSRSCGASVATSAWMNNKAQDLVISAGQSDPDPGNITTIFQIFQASALNGSPVGSLSTGSQSQGTHTVAIGKGSLSEGDYALRAQTTDGIDKSAWTNWCYFSVHNTPPVLPPVPTTMPVAKVGSPVSFTVTQANANIRGFEYWITPAKGESPAPAAPVTNIDPSTSYHDCAPPALGATYVCADANGSATITVTPDNDTDTVYVASIDRAGNISTGLDAGGNTSSATAIPLTAREDPAVDFAQGGHGWLGTGTVGTSINDDGGVTTATGPTAPAPLSIGTTAQVASTTNANGNPAASEIDFPDLISINRFYANGGTHSAVINGSAPTNAHYESHLGDLLSPGATGIPGDPHTSPTAAGMSMLYSCALPGGDMTSPSAGCENTGVTGSPLGYVWPLTAGTPPNGMTFQTIYRCVSGADHFDSTSSTCEGTKVDRILGRFVKGTPTQTSGQVIDTTKAFTVSAWVYPTENSDAHQAYTAVSVAGATNSGFFLQLAAGHFKFCMRTQTAPLSSACVVSNQGISLNTWTFVTGIYDPASQEIRVLTGADLTSQVTATRAPTSGDKSATGGLLVGNAIANGATGDDWVGGIEDPTVFQGVADGNQLTRLLALGRPVL